MFSLDIHGEAGDPGLLQPPRAGLGNQSDPAWNASWLPDLGEAT